MPWASSLHLTFSIMTTSQEKLTAKEFLPFPAVIFLTNKLYHFIFHLPSLLSLIPLEHPHLSLDRTLLKFSRKNIPCVLFIPHYLHSLTWIAFPYSYSFSVPTSSSVFHVSRIKNHDLDSKVMNFTQIITLKQSYPDSRSWNSVLKCFNIILPSLI